MTEDIYTNGSATLGSPSHSNGREVRKIRLIQFEKATEEPMVRAGKIPKPGGTQGGGGAGRSMPVGWPIGGAGDCWRPWPQEEGAGSCLLSGDLERAPSKSGDACAKRNCSRLSWPSRGLPPSHCTAHRGHGPGEDFAQSAGALPSSEQSWIFLSSRESR